MESPIRIVICGGGASSVLLLTALRKHRFGRPLSVTVVDPRELPGLGVAYSTTSPVHLLNTRACNMAVGDDPDDFVHWLKAQRPRRVLNWTRNDFAPRRYFGEYLQTKIAELAAAPDLNLTRVQATADAVIAANDGWEVVLSRGAPLRADIVVLATGNETPRALGTNLTPQAQRLILNDPWDPAQTSEIPRDAAVLLAGTGLTAVDVAVDLLHRGHKGPIHAFSRHGLLPRPHGPVAPSLGDFRPTLPPSVRGIVAHVRKVSEGDSSGAQWRAAFTELRSVAPVLWQGWDLKERRRFLRHARPYWDVHRHRVAPRIHAKLTRALASGQLRLLRGGLASIDHHDVRNSLSVALRQRDGLQVLEVARLINCTGPEQDPTQSANPLLSTLIGDSVARPDVMRLGLAVDASLRVIGRDGKSHRTMFAVGALTRGSRWDVTAIAELRDQAGLVAREIERHAAAYSREKEPFGAPLGRDCLARDSFGA
jgi:uncharacterized NAD(P)/FAD-binding protein YdhS